MIDAHVHLEKGSYCIEWLQEFIQYALARNVDEIYFLEHTHIFEECGHLYDEMSRYNEYQAQWFSKKQQNARPLREYTEFIDNMKKHSFPLKVKFGLEVCYSPGHEADIQFLKEAYPFDFLVGAVHFIDGWAFSHKKQPWEKEAYDLHDLYARYYGVMYQLVKSNLFSGLAHPNSLQCFGAYPPEGFAAEYEKIAAALHKNHMYVEESSGLAINYGDTNLGMNPDMLDAMIKYNVVILTASDAHVPQNVGKMIPRMEQRIERARNSWSQNERKTSK